MENPYNEQPVQETYSAQVKRMEKGIAWNEGHAAAKAGQAEIVSGLVKAAEATVKDYDSDGEISSLSVMGLQHAIAKAKGD